MPKVSIIFPFYNCEKFIEEAFSSFKYLSSSDFEIIVINDGSTDQSAEIAHKLLRGFSIDFTFINRTVNQGCFKARTEGIEASRGEYIAIADADDISLTGRLEKQLNFMELHTEMFCCGGWAAKIDQNGQEIGVMDYPPRSNREIINKIKLDPTSNPIIDPTTMFRKNVFYELGGYSFAEDRNLVADMDLWFRALKCEKIFYNIPIVFIEYRINPDGNTRSHQKEMIKQHVRVRNEFIKGI